MESRLRFDLQFFAETAGERTEKATPKKRREARKKGQIAKSQELSTAFLLLGVFITLHLLSGRWAQEVGEFASDWFSHLAREDLSITGTVDLLTDAVLLAGQVLAPVFLAAVIIGVLINFLQVGAYFQPDLIKPKLDKLNPISGFKRIFSTRALVELVKSLLKLLIVGTVAFLTIRPALKPMLMLWAMEPAAAFSEVESTIFALTWRVGLA
ncbi:MAG: EscU/YscU/HrcU family type III secretion system export apparatus switch protein, partial [Firmicutes bacterium]|nr:EscU/YscU/HrcU family type III secretion system export apparatus switch protein [Bacillota bacterium]